MGNKSTNITSANFNPNQWTITDRQQSQNQSKGNYQILQHKKTHQLIDQYQLLWPSQQDFTFYLDSYNWRKNQDNIVQSKYILQQHKDQFCSKTFQAKIYIEHIPTRLSDITDIPYPDNLYVLLSTLEGYQKLYENLHYFVITEDQICVDKDGVVKVWVNSNLSKNYPESDSNNTHDKKDQSHMVDEIMNMVWENTDEESEPASFKQFFIKKKGKKRIGFDQAKVIVNQYAKNTSSQIPQKFNSILQMRQQSSQFQSNSKNSQQQQNNDFNQFTNENNTGINVSAGQYNSPTPNQIIKSNNQQSSAHFYHPNTNLNSQMYNSASNSSQFYHMPTTQINPSIPLVQVVQPPSFISHPLNYSQSYTYTNPQPIVTRHVSPIRSLPSPIVITQQFIPKSLGNHSGHIISIPPPVAGARFHLSNNKRFPSHYVSIKNNMNQHHQHHQHHKIQEQQQQDFQLQDQQQKTVIQNQHHIHNDNDENFQLHEQSRQVQEDQRQYQQPFQKQDVNIFLNNLNNNNNNNNNNNRNQDYQQRICNNNNNTTHFHNKREQLFSQSQRYSQKNQQNQLIINNNNKNQYQSDMFGYQSNRYSNQSNNLKNSKNLVNKSHQFDKNVNTNNSNHFMRNLLNNQNQDSSDQFKYYTLDQQMELDEEIAADLKKFIMAA